MPSCVVKTYKNSSKSHKKSHGITFHFVHLSSVGLKMKTIKIEGTRDINEKYRKKCIHLEKLIKMMAVLNACQNDRAAALDREVQKVLAERTYLLDKLLEYNDVVEPTQLYYKGKCESKYYKDYKNRITKKKIFKKPQ